MCLLHAGHCGELSDYGSRLISVTTTPLPAEVAMSRSRLRQSDVMLFHPLPGGLIYPAEPLAFRLATLAERTYASGEIVKPPLVRKCSVYTAF